jgi:hypothetical protein
VVRNHIIPYVGHLQISEVNREISFSLLVKLLPAKEASQVTIRATRKVLSAMWHMVAAGAGHASQHVARFLFAILAAAASCPVASVSSGWRKCISIRSPHRLHTVSIRSLAYEWLFNVNNMPISWPVFWGTS